jgi:gliding motility-associated-like protein
MKKLLLLLLILPSLIYGQCEGNISYTLSTPSAADNTYPPGSTVELCITMDGWNGNAQGSNWFEGFYIALGGGWQTVTPTLFPADAEADGSGTWLWMNSVTSANGATAGNGFYFEGPTGPTDGDPGNDWGDFCAMGDCIWTCCVELVAANGPSGMDLHIGVIPYSDGSMGSWGTQMCNETQTSLFEGSIGCTTCGCMDNSACNYNPLACCDDGSCDYLSMGSITHNMMPCPDTVCTGLNVGYSVTGNQTSVYDWHLTGGGTLVTDQSKDCNITWGNTTGTYTITVQETTPQGCISQIEECEVVVVDPVIIFDTTYAVCPNQIVELSATPAGGTWTSPNVQDGVFMSNIPGLYSPEYSVFVHGCQISDFATVTVRQPYPAPELFYDVFEHDLCFSALEQTYTVNGPSDLSYFWNVDGVLQQENSNQIQITWSDTTLTHELLVCGIDGFGCITDTSYMTVKTTACNRLYIPNSFTPNNDKVNDVFGVFGSGVYDPKLRVYNKWGHCVFESNSSVNRWTGNDGSGYYCPDGVYYWTLNYRDTNGFNKNEQGHVILIR